MVTTKPVRDYLAAFDLRAVFVAPGGDVRVGLDSGVADSAWWTGRRDAHRVARRARSTVPIDIPAATAQLGILLTEHDEAVARARAAVTRINATLAAAHARGDLRFFNSEFRRRRAAARAAGVSLMRYAEAMRRLRRELACVAAGRILAGVVARVFGARAEGPQREITLTIGAPDSRAAPVPSPVVPASEAAAATRAAVGRDHLRRARAARCRSSAQGDRRRRARQARADDRRGISPATEGAS